MYNLSRVNKFLNDNKNNDEKSSDIVVNGPDTIKNILMCETVKLAKLEQVSNELLNYITDSKVIKHLSYKEKQNLLKTVIEIQTNSRDFIFKVAELSSKNEFLKKVLELSQEPKEKVITSDGEVFDSSIDEKTRKQLSEMIREVANNMVRNG